MRPTDRISIITSKYHKYKEPKGELFGLLLTSLEFKRSKTSQRNRSKNQGEYPRHRHHHPSQSCCYHVTVHRPHNGKVLFNADGR